MILDYNQWWNQDLVLVKPIIIKQFTFIRLSVIYKYSKWPFNVLLFIFVAFLCKKKVIETYLYEETQAHLESLLRFLGGMAPIPLPIESLLLVL